MRTASQNREWVDGFLFLGNALILDFLNTKPVLVQGPTELLPDFDALARWLIASGAVNTKKTRSLLKSWRNSTAADAFVEELIAFRERLRDAVLRLEAGSVPSDEFIKEVNTCLRQHPPHISLRKRDGQIVPETVFDPQTPADLWAPFIQGSADLLTQGTSARVRKCEGCILHFLDTSKKGSRRWCSMNICGNKVKVAAYKHRKRGSNPVGR